MDSAFFLYDPPMFIFILGYFAVAVNNFGLFRAFYVHLAMLRRLELYIVLGRTPWWLEGSCFDQPNVSPFQIFAVPNCKTCSFLSSLFLQGRVALSCAVVS